jgi:type IV pilus assembly protein PilA
LPYVGDTTKYLKRGVNPLMPTKPKGMTSLEIAIIVAIVLIIAVAVGWYLYTTFVASTTGQPRLNVVSAELSNRTRQLNLTLVNPGPVEVQISTIEIAGQTVTPSCTTQSSSSSTLVIKVGDQAKCTANVGLSVTPGTMLPGRVILSGGQSFPFSALVKP